jgi:hypothetical protein
MKILLITLSFLLVGCSTSVLRVVDAQGSLRSITGKACAVHQSGKENSFANVTIYYSNGACTVEVNNVQD